MQLQSMEVVKQVGLFCFTYIIYIYIYIYIYIEREREREREYVNPDIVYPANSPIDTLLSVMGLAPL